eukprot:4003108-Lingulodinium_polyedra.AAC.1
MQRGGAFDIRGPLGQHFTKQAKHEEFKEKMDLELQKLAAAGTKPHEAKQAFRQEWAKETYKERVQGRVFEKQWAK